MPRSLMALMLLLVLAAAACGDKGEEEAGSTSGVCATLAAAPATGSTPALPQGFPQESQVTFVATSVAGPTSITIGSSTAGLESVYQAYKADLAKAPYSVTKSEKEEDDAEVNFASADTTGQVKLQKCSGGKLAVQVTARPK